MVPLKEEVPCTGGEHLAVITHYSYSSAPLEDSSAVCQYNLQLPRQGGLSLPKEPVAIFSASGKSGKASQLGPP